MEKSSQESNDIFGVSKKNIARFFDEIEKSSPAYHQSVVKLQQDYIEFSSKVDASIGIGSVDFELDAVTLSKYIEHSQEAGTLSTLAIHKGYTI